MKSKGIQKIVLSALVGIMAFGGTAVFAKGYGGYKLPVNQGANYWGPGTKSTAGTCVYNEVNLLTNTDEADFWITKSNQRKNSDYYYFQEGDTANMYAWSSFTTGYLGMRNHDKSSTEAYVDGWVNFN